MSKEIVDVIIEGGKASAGAAMGKAFGPLGVNLQAILEEINEKTKDFKGMKVPVKVMVETEDKSFEIEVGSPSVSELIKTEINLKKGSGDQANAKVGNLAIEQIIKIARMKKDSMLANNLKSAVKMVIGSCQSLGLLVESKEAKETSQDVFEGKYDKEINEEMTEVSSEKLERLNSEFRDLEKKQAEVAKAKEEEEKKEAEEPAEGGEAEPVAEGAEEVKPEEGKEEEKK
ncbi:50S ribosomal protein L11 [Candidatus Woesearchaeota archaeon]|jgi:large subunit ribosomal protein L11|nr:50S ribosomal protein L11 [Candidatus Woesearchaeota archaeon]MBT4322202.1 50S ribosomal protein L11 [Candidatus Woesearchaeota archaeon]MBT4631222.1 50S ribosomal protein L11 [Candidatus Woesearchaeota archaeon]